MIVLLFSLMMKPLYHRKRRLRRAMLLLFALLAVSTIAYHVWSPGERIIDGRHDLRSNGIWLQHGWLGDDAWFARTKKDRALFRDDEQMQDLADLFSNHGVKYCFPHLCPCSPSGTIASVDPRQTERFLDHFEGFRVLPWIGGVLNVHCFPASPEWRTAFIASVVDLLHTHPRLAGIHLNIEPMPSGNQDFLLLLQELRQVMGEGKILSVAAYPPPSIWHPFPEVHWEERYFRAVSGHADQMVVMMYDTAIFSQKIYRHLISNWTLDVLYWGSDSEVLLGVPAYNDAGVGYHNPKVENLQNSLLGIHAGLARLKKVPANYRGISIYCEWEMDEQKWSYLKAEFEKTL